MGQSGVSGNRFLWPDYAGIRQRNTLDVLVNAAASFFGYDPAAARNGTEESIARRACGKERLTTRKQKRRISMLCGRSCPN
jgi:hypothetical protein